MVGGAALEGGPSTLGRDGHEDVAVAAEARVGDPERLIILRDDSHDQVAVWGRQRRAQSR